MGESLHQKSSAATSTAVQIDIRIGRKVHRLAYVQAFALACSMLKQGHVEDAAILFERLAAFKDQGPRAFIMQAFCLAAGLHFDQCSKPLAEVFNGDRQPIAADLHNAFVSYHVGIRQDALTTMIELVNKYRDLPTLCLLLGNMFETGGESAMARKCWSLAIYRDHPGGSIAAVAASHLNRVTDK